MVKLKPSQNPGNAQNWFCIYARKKRAALPDLNGKEAAYPPTRQMLVKGSLSLYIECVITKTQVSGIQLRRTLQQKI